MRPSFIRAFHYHGGPAGDMRPTTRDTIGRAAQAEAEPPVSRRPDGPPDATGNRFAIPQTDRVHLCHMVRQLPFVLARSWPPGSIATPIVGPTSPACASSA